MTTLRDALAEATRTLGDRAEAEILLLHVLEVGRAWLYAHAPDAIDHARLEAFRALAARRAAGEPIAYITGRRGFWTLDLAVDAATLIPRAETETLIELALARMPREASARAADLGTGSGAIALALASERPRARIRATDASHAALAVARANAERLGIANVDFAQGDWCAALGAQSFDLIASNPPYIAEGDPHLALGDLRFEPRSALASGADGLDAIRTIVAGAGEHLVPGGWLLLEHGWNQAEAVRALLARHGFDDVASWPDLEARDRVSGGRWRG